MSALGLDYYEQHRQNREVISQASDNNADLETKSELQKMLEFESRVAQLVKEYDMDRTCLLAVINTVTPEQEPKAKKRIKEKTYRHPVTGETLTTRSKRNKKLQLWKEEFPGTNPDEWVIDHEAAAA